MKMVWLALLFVVGVHGGEITFGTVRTGKGKPAPLVWEERGNGLWHVMRGGTLTGARDVVNSGPKKKFIADPVEFRNWVNQQAWIYTKAEYGDCDLEFEH